MVVIYHSQALLRVYQSRIGIPPSVLNATPNLSTVGASGVDLFFVISGFIMAYITYNQRGIHNILPFIMRRIVRIVPVYWFYTLIMAGLLLLAPAIFSSARFDGYETLLSLLFIPYNPTINPTAPILEVGWTLSYEMYFYILVACGLLFGCRFFSIFLGLFFVGSVALGFIFSVHNPIIQLATNPILFEFYLGYLCGYMFMRKIVIPKGLAFFCFVSGLAGYILWVMDITKLPLGLFAFLIVTGSVFLEDYFKSNAAHVLSLVGDSSYTLYLSHYLLIPALGKICIAIGFWDYFPPSAFVVFSLPSCVIVGCFLYAFIERPLVRWLSHRKGFPGKPPATLTAEAPL